MSDDSYILVTGATGVVGAAVTGELLRRGKRVIAAYAQSASTAESLRSGAPSGGLETVAANLTDIGGIQELLAQLDVREFEVAGFVHSAALIDHTAAVNLEPSLFGEVLMVNVTAAYAIARALATRGTLRSVVLLSSIASEFTDFGSVAYTTSKGAVDALTRALASELAPTRVNAVAPGIVRSHRTAEDPVFSSSDFAARISLGELVDPIALSDVVAFLLGSASRAMTGQILRVDGGHSLRLLS